MRPERENDCFPPSYLLRQLTFLSSALFIVVTFCVTLRQLFCHPSQSSVCATGTCVLLVHVCYWYVCAAGTCSDLGQLIFLFTTSTEKPNTSVPVEPYGYKVGRDSAVGNSDWLRAGRSEDRIPVGAR